LIGRLGQHERREKSFQHNGEGLEYSLRPIKKGSQQTFTSFKGSSEIEDHKCIETKIYIIV
jgi:hypothetical protein